MAEIVFIPMCSECKIPVKETVQYNNSSLFADDYDDFKIFKQFAYSISPSACPTCGARFNRISTPDPGSITKFGVNMWKHLEEVENAN